MIKKDSLFFVLSIILFLISIIVRYFSLPYSNDDMNVHNLIWYKVIISQGVWNALGTSFTNYSPPYSYLLGLISVLKGFVEPLTAIKIIPILFDVFTALLIYRIVRIKYHNGNIPLFASATYFATPTVLLNSSYWGQVDSIYTFFLIACIYFIVIERFSLAWILLGISLSVKAQGVFIFPLFLILALRRQINWKGILWLPITYIIIASPTVLLGRPIFDVIFIYVNQSNTYETLSRNAPNLYIFFPQSWYQIVFFLGISLAFIISTTWIISSVKYNSHPFDYKKIFFYALISVSILPYMLPKMHDRYFYPADVLSIIVAFLNTKLWFLPILFQAISLPGYNAFLFEGDQKIIYVAAILNTITIAILLRKQNAHMDNYDKPKTTMISILTTLLILIVPIIVMGTGIRFVLTSTFTRLEYFVFMSQQNDKQILYERDIHIIEYVIDKKEGNYLRQLQDEQGNPILEKESRQTLGRIS